MQRSTWAQEHYDRLVSDPEFVAAQLMIEVNEQIAQRMEELGVSQHELARRIGKKQPFISRLLNHGTNVTMRTLASLAIALNAVLTPPRLIGKEVVEGYRGLNQALAQEIQVRIALPTATPTLAGDFVKSTQVHTPEITDHDQCPVAA